MTSSFRFYFDNAHIDGIGVSWLPCPLGYDVSGALIAWESNKVTCHSNVTILLIDGP
jgi:hypothetical protein